MQVLIWDLDGTLLDSYPIIVDSTARVLNEIGVSMDRRDIHKYLIDRSVGALLMQAAEEKGLSYPALWARYTAINNDRDDEIALVRGAAETLVRLAERGMTQFVYTHKGETAETVLERLGILAYFAEVVTAAHGFPRKPRPEGVLYLMETYGLDPVRTFYVGDRRLDVECARNAGIRSILFLDPDSPGEATGREDHIVRDLLSITEIFS